MGRAPDCLSEIWSATFERREIIVAMQDRATRFQPVNRETGLQLSHDRTGHFIMIIAIVLRRISVAGPDIGNPGASDKRDLTIDNEQFAMSAIIVTARIGPESGVIFHDSDPGLAQSGPIFQTHLSCAFR